MPFFSDRRKPAMPTGINDLNKARSDSMMSMPEAQRRSLERMGRGYGNFSDPKPPAAGQAPSASNKRYAASQKTARTPKRMQRGK